MSFQFIKPASVADMLVSSKLSNYSSEQKLTNVHEVCFITDIVFTINKKVQNDRIVINRFTIRDGPLPSIENGVTIVI